MLPEIQTSLPKAVIEDERSTSKLGLKPNPEANGTALLVLVRPAEYDGYQGFGPPEDEVPKCYQTPPNDRSRQWKPPPEVWNQNTEASSPNYRNPKLVQPS
jgi:hypothetical protein